MQLPGQKQNEQGSNNAKRMTMMTVRFLEEANFNGAAVVARSIFKFCENK